MGPNNALEKNKGEALLRSIVGARLTSVEFVLDYLILGFDQKGSLTTLVWPELVDAEKVFRIEQGGYRDRLCGLIGHIVEDAGIGENETITIRFEDIKLRIPLQSRKVPGERAIFTAPKHHLYTW